MNRGVLGGTSACRSHAACTERNVSISVLPRPPGPAGSLLPGQRSREPVFMLQLDEAGGSGTTRARVGRIPVPGF